MKQKNLQAALGFESEKIPLQKEEPSTALFPWPRSDVAGKTAIAVTLWTIMMEMIVVRFACYLIDNNDTTLYKLANAGWQQTLTADGMTCNKYDDLLTLDLNTMYLITTWPLSNYLADSYKIAIPMLLVTFVLYWITFSNRHPTVDANGERYWGNTMMCLLLIPIKCAVLVIAFVTDGHDKQLSRSCVNQENHQYHLMAALIAFGGFTLYGSIITISLLVDVLLRKTVKSSIAIWTTIIYGGLCNIACAYFFYQFTQELGFPTYHQGGYVYEWLFINTAWLSILTIPMLTMWAEPTAN